MRPKDSSGSPSSRGILNHKVSLGDTNVAVGSKPLEEREDDDLQVGEPFKCLVTSSPGIEQRTSVVHEAEEDGQGLFRAGEPWGMVGVSIYCSFARGDYDGPFLSRTKST